MQQWEKEQHGGDSPALRSYWDRNLSSLYGCRVNWDMCKPRPRGCLKHVRLCSSFVVVVVVDVPATHYEVVHDEPVTGGVFVV